MTDADDREPAPAVFISHGAPTVALEENAYTRALAEFGREIGSPRAVVVVSAHWQAPLPVRVNVSAQPEVIHDFRGFPAPLYGLRYPAPGAPALAQSVLAILEDAGFPCIAESARGWDHGVWVPLRIALPSAQVPILEVSLPSDLGPEGLLKLGETLGPLRGQGTAILGSGGLVHNLQRVRMGDEHDAGVDAWAREFDAWVRERLDPLDLPALVAYRRHAPHAELAAPTSEHFDPLFVVLGARRPSDLLVDLHAGFRYRNLSMRSFLLAEA